MKHRRAYLYTAADHHLRLVVRPAGALVCMRFFLLLRLRYRMRPRGRTILGAGEALLPDFVRGSLQLEVSHESMVGLTLFSDSDEGDTFLQMFAERHAGVAPVRDQALPQA